MLKYFYCGFFAFFIATNAFSEPQVTPYNFLKENSQEISFSDIPKTIYELQTDGLKFQVKNSSSALIFPFKKIQTISGVKFSWQTIGKLSVKNVEQLQSKKGDDAYIRVGLILHGKAPSIPFFAPSWIKMISKSLMHSSDKIEYLTITNVGKKNLQWVSPYADSISSMQVDVATGDKDQGEVSVEFKAQKKVVGLWIQSDGDNTQSQFKGAISSLQLIR